MSLDVHADVHADARTGACIWDTCTTGLCLKSSCAADRADSKYRSHQLHDRAEYLTDPWESERLLRMPRCYAAPISVDEVLPDWKRKLIGCHSMGKYLLVSCTRILPRIGCICSKSWLVLAQPHAEKTSDYTCSRA